jgi:hypothetical protein
LSLCILWEEFCSLQTVLVALIAGLEGLTSQGLMEGTRKHPQYAPRAADRCCLFGSRFQGFRALDLLG